MLNGKYLTTQDIAKKLRVSVGRIRQFVAEKRIKVAMKIGNVNFFDPENVEKFARIERKTGKPKKSI